VADAGRVIAGRARGIRLEAPGGDTRPLGDRLKEALFATLEPQLREAAVLDLFAGSGAGGIEALSRGARLVVFVERAPDAIGVIGRNLDRTHLAGPGAAIRHGDALAYLSERAAADGPFDVALVDPPYADGGPLMAALESLGRAAPRTMTVGGVVVAKHRWRTALPTRVGLLASARQRRFGETMLTFFRVEDPAAPSEAR